MSHQGTISPERLSVVSALSNDDIFAAAMQQSQVHPLMAVTSPTATTPNIKNGKHESAPSNDHKECIDGSYRISRETSPDSVAKGKNGKSPLDLELGTSQIQINSRRSTMGGIESSGRSRNFFPNTLKKDTRDYNRLPRLVLRDRAFHQSSNKVHIQHNQGARIFKLLKHNLFFVFLRMSTWKSLTALISLWTGAILLFAVLYMIYDNGNLSTQCGLGIDNGPIHFASAFAFSLETCTTVGM